MNLETLSACRVCSHNESQRLESLSRKGSCIMREVRVIKWPLSVLSKRKQWNSGKENDKRFIYQNFSLSRFPGNANCSFIWSLSHWIIWQFSSLRLAEALSIECDAQWNTSSRLKPRAWIIVIHWQTWSTMMILINDSMNIYGNDLLKTGSCFWLLNLNTQLITKSFAVISFS